MVLVSLADLRIYGHIKCVGTIRSPKSDAAYSTLDQFNPMTVIRERPDRIPQRVDVHHRLNSVTNAFQLLVEISQLLRTLDRLRQREKS